MSQQNGLGSSSGPVAGRLAHPTQGMRSDSTKPSRSSSASRTSIGSGGITRQGSTGQVAGAVRSARLSLGASGTLSGRPSAAQGSSSTAAGATASVLTSAAPTTATGSAAAAVAAPRQSKATVAAAQPTPATAAGEALTPVPPSGPRPVVFENKLYGEDVPSFTPTVNKGYTGKLSPQMDELQQKRQAEAEAAAAEASTAPSAAPAAAAVAPTAAAVAPTVAAAAAAGASEAAVAAHSIAFSNGRPIGRAIVVTNSSSSSSSKPPVPQHFLRSTGDLFTMPDQQRQQVPQEVTMADSQLKLFIPAWNQSRPWLTGTWLMQRPEGFMQEAGTSPEQQLPPLVDLATATPIDAEALLVDDLLTVMMGQGGQFIKHALVEAGTTYPRLGLWVQGVPDPSLQEQVERLLPLCEAVYVIKRFVETRSQIEHPMVMQALAAAMRKLQEEWWVLVVQLEHQHKLGQLNLAALLYYCQAPSASLVLLASIAGEAASFSSLTSAGLLNLLVARQRSLAGDRAGQQLVGQLLEAAAEPYFGILRQWLCSGVLDDPYNEFMVKKDDNIKKDSLTPLGDAAYWSMRYTIRRGIDAERPEELDIPVFLESSVDAILVTGKYLNVIRECGQPVPPCPNSTLAQLRYDAAAAERGSPPWLSGIQAALSAAAGALLAHMAGPQGRLLSWLYCLKHVFLLDQGDFLVHLMEQGDAESSAPLSALAPHQLQGLLDAALRSSSVAASPHIGVITDGVLSIKVDKRTIVGLVMAAAQQTQQESPLCAAGDAGESGWQHLMLSLNLSWPINLVVGKRQLRHYQVIFRQLVSLKHTEKELGYAWQALRATKRLSKSDQAHFRPWHLLCSQLLHVVVEVLRYTTIDVLEPLWADMHSRLQQAGNMDEVIQLHNAFLSTALDRSLLHNTVGIVKPLHQLLSAAQNLSNVVKSIDVTRTASSDDGGGGNSSSRRGKTAQHQLQMLTNFCRDANRQHQLSKLQHLVRQQLELLLKGLDSHYEQLGQAPLASSAASFTPDGDAGPLLGGQGQWGRGVAAVGDSSRELASLHNLLERLRLAEPSPGALMV